MSKRRQAALACLSLLFCSQALATVYSEIESNNTFSSAQLLGPHDGTVVVNGSRMGDPSADFFTFYATGGDNLTLSVVNPSGFGASLGFLDPSGNFIAMTGAGSGTVQLSGVAPTSGVYGVAVSGYPDLNVAFNGVIDFRYCGFTNACFQDWDYQLTISGLSPQVTSAVPLPGTAALLAIGSLAFWRRRR